MWSLNMIIKKKNSIRVKKQTDRNAEMKTQLTPLQTY